MSDFDYGNEPLRDVVQRLAGQVEYVDDPFTTSGESVCRADIGGTLHEVVVLEADRSLRDVDRILTDLQLEGPTAESYVAVRGADASMHVAPMGLVLKVAGYSGLFGDIRIAPTTACYECSAEMTKHHYSPDDVEPDPLGLAYCTKGDGTVLVLHDPCTTP